MSAPLYFLSFLITAMDVMESAQNAAGLWPIYPMLRFQGETSSDRAEIGNETFGSDTRPRNCWCQLFRSLIFSPTIFVFVATDYFAGRNWTRPRIFLSDFFFAEC